MPGLSRDVDRRPGHDGHRFLFDRGAPLALVYKQHLILMVVPVHGNLRARQERLGAHDHRPSRFLWIDFDDDLPGSGRTELQNLALTGLEDTFHFLVSQPSFWHGQHLKSESTLSTPATPITP